MSTDAETELRQRTSPMPPPLTKRGQGTSEKTIEQQEIEAAELRPEHNSLSEAYTLIYFSVFLFVTMLLGITYSYVNFSQLVSLFRSLC